MQAPAGASAKRRLPEVAPGWWSSESNVAWPGSMWLLEVVSMSGSKANGGPGSSARHPSCSHWSWFSASGSCGASARGGGGGAVCKTSLIAPLPRACWNILAPFSMELGKAGSLT